MPRNFLVLCNLLLFIEGAFAEPWHLPGWTARAIIEIQQPCTEPGVDTVGVKINCHGRGKADGSDYRVLDATGQPLPFQLMFHDAPRYSLISFRVLDPRQRYFIYFGNARARSVPEQIVIDPQPGAGPSRASWLPRHGLVYTTMQRPEGANPRTVAEMAKLIAGSRAKHGARYQRKISDGYNPFGSSDYYISIYRGWMRIPVAGKYQFCTISNEASFSFLDGKELVHWPGRHTVDRGIHGEKNATVELAAGLHYIEYYHEEVTLEQMAFLGWRPSADQGPFSAIPESIYTAPHAGVVKRYESPAGPLVHFEPIIQDTIWPSDRHEGQYTRCLFRVGKDPALPAQTQYHWQFGDGQTATGPDVEHVYLTLGRYQVTLEARGPLGLSKTQWPLEVYEMQHVTDEIKEGRLEEYARLARTYDRGKLDAPNLKELAYLFAESAQPAEAIQVGKEFLKQFSTSQPHQAARMRRLLADAALRLGQGNLEEAIANYQASITKETPAAERLDVYARLIHLLGLERDLPKRVDEILASAEETRRTGLLDEEGRAAYRRVVIAVGDVRLWHAKPEEARGFYQRAEILTGRYLPPQVRAARIGAFPNSIREFLAAGNLGAALDVVNRWEETFPTEKIHGQTFFWRGKILNLREQPKDAARYLARAIGLAVGADFESEARWLLAQALEKMGRTDEARKELVKLVVTGISDSFTKMARAKLSNDAPAGKPKNGGPQ